MSRIVTFGEIMVRLATPGLKRIQQAMPGSLNVTFAGAEASVASSVAYLGGDAAFVTALPEHAIADACIASLHSIGVKTRNIVRTPQGRLGLYFFEAGANHRPGNVIYDREGSSVAITPADAYDWNSIFDGAEWFELSGITPAISRNAAQVASVALSEAERRSVKVAVDMNYRSKLWRWDDSSAPRELATRTMSNLLKSADLFIGAREDAEALLGTAEGQPLEDLMRQITQQFPRVSQVAMTVRKSTSATHNHFGGILFQKATDEFYHSPENGALYSITNIVDRLGAGDAFTAGLLYAQTIPELSNPHSAIAFATAAGCLAHSIEGDINFSSREEIEALMKGNISGGLKR